MPNYCNYEMRAKGRACDVKKLMEWLQADYHYPEWKEGEPAPAPDVYVMKDDKKIPTEHHIGYRTFECWYDEDEIKDTPDSSTVCISADGYVAWSCYSCWFDGPHTYYDDNRREGRPTLALTLPDACRILKVECEFYSQEPGMCFSEHYHIGSDGTILADDCVEYSEIDIDGYKTYEDLLKAYTEEGWTLPKRLTKARFEDALDNGDSFVCLCDFLDSDGCWPFGLELEAA